ncbi:right-handed parallel beta-helix repeat-containing protein [Donghicola eburneus]|uniref:right-handed parallel beta-helix repeat-containing protein n=1 Tax=Donghicola eburneus TaxID=393278 RepID=UPI0008F0FBC6|nr:right-handed parallel beta-helix repeat-containing protein [Donghicola eburneus]SFQ56841.1 Right handed beta helix region [Donghicola eburneus]
MTDLYVSSAEDLYAALAHAKAGQHIYLVAGEYDDIAIWYGLGIDLDLHGVTLASADPSAPAVIHNFEAKGVSNLTISDVVFDYDYRVGQPTYKRPFEFIDCTNIKLDQVTFNGDVATDLSPEADGFGTGIGLSVRGNDGFTLTDSALHGFMIGASFGNSTNVSVTGNDISEMRIDGLTFTKMQNVTIAGNTIHDFLRSPTAGDHADMIQFWTNGNVTPTTDIRILNNTLMIADGDPTQGIFIGNEALAQGFGEEMFYDGLEISGNTLLLEHLNGIYVGGARDLVVSENTVLNPASQAEDSALPRIRVDPVSSDVTIAGNLVTDIWGDKGQSDWQVYDNIEPRDATPATLELVSSDTTICRLLPPTPVSDSFRFAPHQDDLERAAPQDDIPITWDQISEAAQITGQIEMAITQADDTNVHLYLSEPEFM